MLRSLLSKRSLILAAAALALTGCPDPDGEHEGFLDRSEPQRHNFPDAEPVESGIFDFSGRYVMAIETPIGIGKPLLFDTRVEIELVESPADGAPVGYVRVASFQPLAVADRTAAGPKIDFPALGDAVPIDANGHFLLDMGVVTAVGAANPITGRDIKAELQLDASIRSEDEFCGRALGQVTEPIVLALDGSTFGVVKVTEDQANLMDVGVATKCTASDVVPDAGPPADAAPPPRDGGRPPADAAPPPPDYGRCIRGYEGEYDVRFITETQQNEGADPGYIQVTLVADDDTCYTGTAVSPTTGDTLGTVSGAGEVNGAFTFTVEAFVIPPGANPALPDGGHANVKFIGAAHRPGGLCGTISFDLYDPAPLTNAGTFGAGIGALAPPTTPACAGMPEQPCGFAGLAGDHKLVFITQTQRDQGSEPTVLTAHLEADPLTCLRGWLESRLEPGTKLADIRYSAPAGNGLTLNVGNFVIAPGANPLLPDGGQADIELRGTDVVGDDGLCGTMTFTLFAPFALASEGDWGMGRVDRAEPDGPVCPGPVAPPDGGLPADAGPPADAG